MTDAERLERLREAASHAVLDALAWMDPDTARKWQQEESYKRLYALIADPCS